MKLKEAAVAALLMFIGNGVAQGQSSHDNLARESMEVGPFRMQINMPKALEKKFNSDGKEVSHALPPFALRKVLPASDYLTPHSWDKGDADHSVYFTSPNGERVGMWLDCRYNTGMDNHVAVVFDVQNINPITGVKASTVAVMEQYRVKGPDGKPIESHRWSPSLGYNVPPQNYLASNAGVMWLDGFRTRKGIVRQWVFTEDDAAGVADQLIGDKKDFAVTATFFISKNPKPKAYGGTRGLSKSFDISAGAEIKQKIPEDFQNLDFWNSKPQGKITIYFVSHGEAKEIISRKRQRSLEGFLQGIFTVEDDDPFQ